MNKQASEAGRGRRGKEKDEMKLQRDGAVTEHFMTAFEEQRALFNWGKKCSAEQKKSEKNPAKSNA